MKPIVLTTTPMDAATRDATQRSAAGTAWTVQAMFPRTLLKVCLFWSFYCHQKNCFARAKPSCKNSALSCTRRYVSDWMKTVKRWYGLLRAKKRASRGSYHLSMRSSGQSADRKISSTSIAFCTLLNCRLFWVFQQIQSLPGNGQQVMHSELQALFP